MISSFASGVAEQLFMHGRHAKVADHLARAAQRKLVILDAAMSLDDVGAVPGNRLERLRGNLAGYYSIRVNRQWRITFRWSREGAEDVDFTDYH